MSNFDKHVFAFFPTHIRFGPIQRLLSIRKIINFWYTFGWKWWVISFRDYLGLSDACSYDVDDVIGRADRFGFQNFCSPVHDWLITCLSYWSFCLEKSKEIQSSWICFLQHFSFSLRTFFSLETYGYPSCSFVMANHSFQMKRRYRFSKP